MPFQRGSPSLRDFSNGPGHLFAVGRGEVGVPLYPAQGLVVEQMADREHRDALYHQAGRESSEAARLMAEHHLTQVPVMDPSSHKKLAGILRSSDIFNSYPKLSLKRDELLGSLDQEGSHESGTRHMRFTIFSRSTLAGKYIKELDIPEGIVLTSIERRKMTLVPEGDTILRGRDKIWAVVHPQSEPRVCRLALKE